jgi:rod shape determining protein RodA
MRREFWRRFDFLLMGTVVFLCIFGIILIRSAVAGNAEISNYYVRQAIFVGIGLAIIMITAVIDYHYWQALSVFMYVFVIGFLLVIYVIGQASFGAQRWLELGLIAVQPSELAKIVIILVLAHYFSKNTRKDRIWVWIGGSLILTIGIVSLVIIQPNLSISIVLMVIWFAMLWINGLPTKYIFVFILIGIVMAAAVFPFLEDYQKLRVLTFVYPDPNARHGNNYNIEQALITIGSGGWFGQGYDHATQVQLRFQKVRHTDYIFSVLGAEFGFVGTFLITLMIFFVIYRIFKAAQNAGDLYGSLICYGFGVLMLFQTMVNIGVNLKMVPVTGLTLPFISYGGSSLTTLSIGIGLVQSVIMRSKLYDSKRIGD